MKDQEFEVEKIRSQYTAQQHTELDALKSLDTKVKRPANVFGFSYGSLGAIVMGAGMSLIMTNIGTVLGMTDTMVPGIAMGVVGLTMSCTTYPIYKKILNSRKKKYANKVMECICNTDAKNPHFYGRGNEGFLLVEAPPQSPQNTGACSGNAAKVQRLRDFSNH